MRPIRPEFAVVLCCLGVALFLFSSAAPAAALSEAAAAHAVLLAERLGIGAERLDRVESSTEMLLDGRRLTTIKAIELESGAPVGATFEGTRVVDRYREIARAGSAWRALHGALTPALVRRLDELAAGERATVAAWLKVDLSALGEAKPSEPRRAPESGTATGKAATQLAHEGSPLAAPLVARGAKRTPLGRPFLDPREEQHRREVQAANARADQERHAALRGAIAPVRERFLVDTLPLDFELGYASEIAPVVILDAGRELIEELARWPEIDVLDDASGTGGPSLSYARPTQNMIAINDLGYDGSGIAVSVTEGERAFFANPFLALVNCYACAEPWADHPTAVAGMIRSTHASEHGLADDVDLYSANGSYSSFATMSAAMDWGSTNARVLNNSWYWDAPNSAVFWEADRHQDYFVRYNFDTVAVAAGNFGNGCGGAFSTYVVSPAKGHNILAVGNYDDMDTVGWSDDAMDGCSSFGNPADSAGTGTQEKPEVAAVGAGIWSTTDADPWVGGVGSGTSYASPMVASLAADVMEAAPTIENDPEAVKALLMATALHNIEGTTRLSGKDGAGGIVGAAAIVSTERAHWTSQSIGSGTTWPIEWEQFVYAGERVRFVIAWSSNPNAPYTTDPLPADIDLCAYRADGSTLIACSSSFDNAYEIVDFFAPATETFRFRASLFDSDWSSGGTWLGAGWWRGEYRISPDFAYDDDHPPLTGTHLVVHPADWTPANYWRAFGIRPKGSSDYDLEMATHSLFEDPALRVVEEVSGYFDNETDFIVVDGNHWSSSAPEHYRVLRWSGTDGYHVNFSNLGEAASISASLVTLGPIDMDAAETVKVFDIWVSARSHRRIRVVPNSGSADLSIHLFRSEPGSAASYVQDRGQALVTRDRSASGAATERCGVANSTGAGDWLGLVVVNRSGTSVNFRVEVLPESLFADDFESSDTAEWSTTS